MRAASHDIFPSTPCNGKRIIGVYHLIAKVFVLSYLLFLLKKQFRFSLSKRNTSIKSNLSYESIYCLFLLWCTHIQTLYFSQRQKIWNQHFSVLNPFLLFF